jgi:hypothetical protein
MHLNRLLTALKHSMKDVNLDHVMATPVSASRPFCFFHFHLYSSGRKFNNYLGKLELITQKLIVKNAILILHGDHKSKNINGNETYVLSSSLKNTVNVPC